MSVDLAEIVKILKTLEESKISIQIKQGEEQRNIHCLYPAIGDGKSSTIQNLDNHPYHSTSDIMDNVIRYFEELGKYRRKKGLML